MLTKRYRHSILKYTRGDCPTAPISCRVFTWHRLATMQPGFHFSSKKNGARRFDIFESYRTFVVALC